MELYDLLGVSFDATPSQIRKAYLNKALELHPDRNKDDPKAAENFVALFKAYEILKDEELRKKHDSVLKAQIEKKRKYDQEDETRKQMRSKLEKNELLAADRRKGVVSNSTETEDILSKIKLAQEIENLRRLFKQRPAKNDPYAQSFAVDDLEDVADTMPDNKDGVTPNLKEPEVSAAVINSTLSLSWKENAPTVEEIKITFRPYGEVQDVVFSSKKALVSFSNEDGLENALAFARTPFVISRVSAAKPTVLKHEGIFNESVPENYEEITLAKLRNFSRTNV